MKDDTKSRGAAVVLFLLTLPLMGNQSIAVDGCEMGWARLKNTRGQLELADFRRKTIELLDSPQCTGERQRAISRDAAVAHVEIASKLNIDQRRSVYESAMRFGRPWQLLEATGRLLLTDSSGGADLTRASILFQEALTDVQNEHKASRATDDNVERVFRLAQQSRFLSPVFVRGINFGIATRGIKVQSAIVPIQFDRNSDKMTSLGAKYAEELVEYLKSYNFPKVHVVGHTDHDGSDKHNMALSVRRAQAVKSWLIAQGYSNDRISISGKGYHEPARIENEMQLTQDQIKQILRRVEVQLVSDVLPLN